MTQCWAHCRQQAIKAALSANELSECTFTPAVSKGTERIMRHRSPGRSCAAQGSREPSPDDEPTPYERLYNNAHVMEQRRQQRLKEAQEQEQAQVSQFRARSPGHLKKVSARSIAVELAGPLCVHVLHGDAGGGGVRCKT